MKENKNILIWQKIKKMIICYLWWRIILVNYIYYEDGIKKPYISTSVKRLVLASYAQFGVSAGYESVGRS